MTRILHQYKFLKNHIALKVESIKVRNIHRSTSKIIIRHPNSFTISHSMACFHGVNFKPKAPKSKVNDIDLSGYHPIVSKTMCNESNCKFVNCADPNDVKANCSTRTAQQKQSDLPPAVQGFKTELTANLTSKVPTTKKGAMLNATQNYAGQQKSQEMVVETNTVTVVSDDLNVHMKSTTFLQGHHHILTQNIP